VPEQFAKHLCLRERRCRLDRSRGSAPPSWDRRQRYGVTTETIRKRTDTGLQDHHDFLVHQTTSASAADFGPHLEGLPPRRPISSARGITNVRLWYMTHPVRCTGIGQAAGGSHSADIGCAPPALR